MTDVPGWEAGVSDPVRSSIADAIERSGSLPVLDSSLRRLLGLLDDPDSSTGQLVAAIEGDPEFAAQLLRLANSAIYRRGLGSKTVRQALTQVGRATARRLCLDTATFRFLERAPGNGSVSRGQMHMHAVSVAAASSAVAARAGAAVETAHLAGLLHDFGKLLLPLAFGEEELDDCARAHPGGADRTAAEWERFGIDHAHAGALYARSSGLDDEVCAAIAYHHGGRSGVRVPSPVAACVQLAESVTGMLQGNEADIALTEEALQLLGLEPAALDDLAQSAAGPAAPAAPKQDLGARVAELEQLAHTDDLTGLANRRGWLDQTRRTLAASRSGMLLLCDIDRFKAVNDSFGHATGDVVLTEVARILARHGRAGRLGGDEFAIWLPHHNEDLASRIVSEVEDALQGEISSHTHVSISIGISTAPNDAADLATLLELADAALYEAKRAGGGRSTRVAATRR